MRWMQQVRLYPTAAQIKRLEFMLHVTRHLYNAALQERRDAWKMRGVSVTYRQQYAELTDLRREEPGIAAVYRECQDAILHRLDLAMTAFFRRLKRGETPGYPRFRSTARWKQLEFPHGGRALKLDVHQKRVRIPGVGTIGLRKGRSIPAFGRAFMVEKNGRWYATFECHREAEPLAKTAKVVGIDRGVHVLAATSEGQLIANPQLANKHRRGVSEHACALEQATVKDSRGHCQNRADPKRIAAVQRLARAKEREANARRDWLHKVSRKIVDRFDVIGLEKLSLRSMTRSARGTVANPGRNVAAKSGLNRALLDAGLGILHTLIRQKAAWAARQVVEVEAKYSSQTCSRCGHVAAKSRRRRRFACVVCGFRVHADVNAALEIRRRAQLALRSALSSGSTWLTPQDAA